VTFWSKVGFLKSGFKIFFSTLKNHQESESDEKNTKSACFLFSLLLTMGQSEEKVPKMAKFHRKKNSSSFLDNFYVKTMQTTFSTYY
jgi:hypothetical protein